MDGELGGKKNKHVRAAPAQFIVHFPLLQRSARYVSHMTFSFVHNNSRFFTHPKVCYEVTRVVCLNFGYLSVDFIYESHQRELHCGAKV